MDAIHPVRAAAAGSYSQACARSLELSFDCLVIFRSFKMTPGFKYCEAAIRGVLHVLAPQPQLGKIRNTYTIAPQQSMARLSN
jgi:hypothetical protein